MNPESAPQNNPENHEPVQSSTERVDNNGYELGTVGTHEQEQAMRQVDRQSGPPQPPPTTAPLPPQVVALPTVTQVDDTAVGPTIANDDDVIEKEWVDKAKKIIADTQNDPYKREQEVNKLQIDYLRKRYGKELGMSE